MKLEGKRIKRTRWVHTERYVVAVEVEAVIPAGDSGEPCYEPETVRFLKQVQEHAEADDRDWLREHGRVYVLETAA